MHPTVSHGFVTFVCPVSIPSSRHLWPPGLAGAASNRLKRDLGKAPGVLLSLTTQSVIAFWWRSGGDVPDRFDCGNLSQLVLVWSPLSCIHVFLIDTTLSSLCSSTPPIFSHHIIVHVWYACIAWLFAALPTERRSWRRCGGTGKLYVVDHAFCPWSGGDVPGRLESCNMVVLVWVWSALSSFIRQESIYI